MLVSPIKCLCLLLKVFATYPNEDYDRRNEDVDPMAASAEYELEKRVERLDLFPVELEKGTDQSEDTQSCLFPVSKFCLAAFETPEFGQTKTYKQFCLLT